MNGLPSRAIRVHNVYPHKEAIRAVEVLILFINSTERLA